MSEFRFNPENKETLTYGECFDGALKCETKADAKEYMDGYVDYIQGCLDKKPNSEGLTAREICRCNIGYFTGYYDQETADRVKDLFELSHPVFGG